MKGSNLYRTSLFAINNYWTQETNHKTSSFPHWQRMLALCILYYQLFKVWKIVLMSHGPYSPDLVTNDFSLCPFIRGQMRGRRFRSSEKGVKAWRLQFCDANFRVIYLLWNLVYSNSVLTRKAKHFERREKTWFQFECIILYCFL